MASDPTPQRPLRIGVFHEDVQMADLVGLDIIGNLSVKNMQTVCSLVPELTPMLPLATPMEFLYISSTLSPASMTPETSVNPTHTYATAPRDLDVILIGGPDPSKVHPDSLTFLREAVGSGEGKAKVVMTTCTGGMWLAASGVLEGRKATTNRMLLGKAKEMFPGVEWCDQRWVVEEGEGKGTEIWTAGGAGCGIDMMAEYVNKHFDQKLVGLGLGGLDFDPEGPHGQFYTQPLPTSL
ncbi:DJ-1/PfpI family protein [Lindgomyces ingoldianus]|uniref:DJ-1/PfpI family protein n=1 Tax=Lindgomyces ingoldianus TaxID=673940 RepID=A0ACB6QF00_9PLEO|nr:DJ-1/PfpI family protein [Lindgomyces ingoldianus]KAF2464692.1 DJ-1/PfpI family protein [Lindgomyces ingoldianus]